ncbi:hypothetical protein [Pararhodobacter marinus]|uniref:hypothetical protein n=1 Tax=Pararhodobacter marinus TaxID=2184063 RepID=UPI00351708FB
MVEILCENARFRAVLKRPVEPSDLTVVYWPPLIYLRSATVPSPFPGIQAADFATRRGLNSITIDTRCNDWFQGPEIDEITDAIRHFCTGQSVVISYGISMGGHASVSFGPLIGADYVLAVAPQASLEPNYMAGIGDTRWPDSVPVFRRDHIRAGLCRDVQGVALFDPAQPQDARHVATIVERTRIKGVEVRGGWHHPARIVNRVAGIGDLVRDIAHELRDHGSAACTLDALNIVLQQGWEHRFVTGTTKDRAALLTEVGAATLMKTLEFRSLVAAFHDAPGPDFAAQILPLADTPARRRSLGHALLTHGFAEDGLDLLLADDKPVWGFYHAASCAFLREQAERLGADAWRREAHRLDRLGDSEAALFCFQTLRDVFGGGQQLDAKIASLQRQSSDDKPKALVARQRPDPALEPRNAGR